MAELPINSLLTSVQPKRWLSLDSWAVLLAFAIALLVRMGVLQHISW